MPEGLREESKWTQPKISPAEDRFRYQIVDVAEVAKRLGVPTTWVYEQVPSRAKDPMQHLRLGKYVRFQPDSPEFQAWLARRRVGSGLLTHGSFR